jgi:hypothetical protein
MNQTTTVTIAPTNEAHADAVLAIYRAGIDEGSSTFETDHPPGSTSPPP